MTGRHDHHGAHRADDGHRLAWVLALTVSYMIAEVIGGWLTNSLALLADAGHMLSDAAALALSLFALWVARRPAPKGQTFGYYRAEILAALANGTVLLVIALFVFLEALERLRDPQSVEAPLMVAIACGGLAMNLIGLRILGGAKSGGLNLRGAWLHVLSDALGSIGAVLAGLLIWLRGWHWADPVASLVIALFVVHSAWSLLRETVAVLMESAPGHINVDAVRDAMAGLPTVLEVHDLHIWTITSGMESLSAHVVARPDGGRDTLLAELRGMLSGRFGIDHVTIQVETATDEECAPCP